MDPRPVISFHNLASRVHDEWLASPEADALKDHPFKKRWEDLSAGARRHVTRDVRRVALALIDMGIDFDWQDEYGGATGLEVPELAQTKA